MGGKQVGPNVFRCFAWALSVATIPALRAANGNGPSVGMTIFCFGWRNPGAQARVTVSRSQKI